MVAQLVENPLLVLVGPTAVGKTDLSLYLARRFNGEIVSADSRLFYRGLNIGTAKPAEVERTAIPHHFIDICAPDETLTLAEYQEQAYTTIEAIHRRGRLPILVGGTGQYVLAVAEGWGIPRVPPQPQLRQILQRLGGPELHRWLRYLDPEKGTEIHPNNLRRVIRALEVTLVSGRPISHLQRKKTPPYAICWLGLYREREELYARIDARVEQMMAAGLLAEVKGLQAAGYGWLLPSMSGLGYRQLLDYLAGELTLAEAVERIKFETHRLARQQDTWFRRDDERITWFDRGDEGMETAVFNHVADFLSANAT
jgi:tRNA dimethylallyltransferase